MTVSTFGTVFFRKMILESTESNMLLEYYIISVCFFTYYPSYLRNMLTMRTSSYNLRGNYILDLPKAKTTTYGLHSFTYLASKIWNSLRDTYTTSDFLQFKQNILNYEAFLDTVYIMLYV